MKFTKRIGTTILAGAMALSLSVPAFAASGAIAEADRLAVTKATEFEIEMAGEVYTPVIRVQVMSKGAKMYLNPSKGKIAGEVTGFSEGSTAVPVNYTFESLGVASTPIMIRSDSDNALTVNANVTVTAPKTVELKDAAPAADATTKQAYIQVAGTSSDSVNAKGTVAALTADLFTAVSANKGGVIAASGKAQSVAKVATIAAAKQSDDTIVPQYGGVMLKGSCTKAEAVSWSEDDALTATVILTFSGATA